ncbi:MAG: outer membrane beta-barrel protein [Steroidobacteraceae bacterium]|nr:outer membrane beta-barrel protein [Deltaproteobacteria bacterium]
MKRLLVLACATAALSMTTGAAMADSIKGKAGITGRVGFLIPADGEIGPFKNDTDAGIIGGGGFIFGIDNHFAAEVDVTRSAFESQFGDFGVTNIALGAQYRFALEQPKLVPYVGAGLDILIIDADQGRTVDTTAGVHASGGVDYFLMKQLALTTEAKLVVAPDTDINNSTGKVGNFDPLAFSTTFGVRYFFN